MEDGSSVERSFGSRTLMRIPRVFVALLSLALLSSRPESARAGVQPAQSAGRAGIVATELINRPIEDSRADFAGFVRELVLDSRGSVRLVVVELGSTQDRPIAVPWTYLDIQADGSIRWRATAEQIRRAPAYVSSDNASSDVGREEPTVAYLPSEDPVDRFDPSRVATYRGVVAGTTTGFFQGEVVAIVVVADAQKIRARLGPEIYLTQIGLGLMPGQSVVIQGFSLAGDDPPIVVVSEITVEDKKFVLRNMDGTPLWSRANVPNRLY
jgi:hypothetical protein